MMRNLPIILKDNSVDSDQYIEDVYSLMLEAYQTAL